VEGAIKGRHIELEGVLIRNVTLPDSIQTAINDKLRAEQAALKMKFVIAEAEAQATKQMVETKAESERAKIAAQSEADVKRIDAQATDDYMRITQQHINDRLLQWQKIEAMKALAASPNAKVILMGNEGKSATTVEVK
jgi:regulator of protease activity HflC (stomatin/prohibitin superfamily)